MVRPAATEPCRKEIADSWQFATVRVDSEDQGDRGAFEVGLRPHERSFRAIEEPDAPTDRLASGGRSRQALKSWEGDVRDADARELLFEGTFERKQPDVVPVCEEFI